MFSKSLQYIQIKTSSKIISRYLSASVTEATKTSLYNFHVENKGKLVNFSGYLLPVQYGDMSLTASHLHTRNNASLFDVSHMLQTEIRGKECCKFFESLCTADVKNLQDGTGTLTVFTNEKGGIIDDLIVTKINEKHLYIVSNAGRRQDDIKTMMNGLDKYKSEYPESDLNIQFFDTTERGLLAIQGPKAATILEKLMNNKLENVYFMQSIICTIAGIENCRITRCGYTGEDGFEISLPASQSENLALALLNCDENIKLAGLGARDSLRLEAGLCLYGNDIDETTTPVEAGLTWLVAKSRRYPNSFPGATVILDQIKNGVTRKRIGIISEQGPPARNHTDIYIQENEKPEEVSKVGCVTSGLPSPSLKGYNIAMGYISNKHNKIGNSIMMKIRDKFYSGKITKLPFIKCNYYNKK